MYVQTSIAASHMLIKYVLRKVSDPTCKNSHRYKLNKFSYQIYSFNVSKANCPHHQKLNNELEIKKNIHFIVNFVK